jgi:transcription elongation factor GreA
MADIFVSEEALEKMRADLHAIKSVKRREIVMAIQEARAHGDLSENAEYDAAREAQAHNEKRIAELEEQLTRVRIIDKSNVPPDTVCIGKSVTLLNKTTNKQVKYELVAPEVSDFDAGKISITSPMGRALIGKSLKEEVAVKAPAGVTVYKIMKMSM